MAEPRLTIINIIQIILENIIYIISNSYVFLTDQYLWCMNIYYYYLPKYTITWIKNNNIIHKIKFNTINSHDISKSLNTTKPDYYIISYKPESIYLTYIKQELLPSSIPLEINITPCNFHFINVLIKSNTKKTNITSFLFNRNNNYYISNMIIFDKYFNNYISRKLLPDDEQDINEIHIIDNMANNIILNKNQYILLSSTNYTIINKSE